MHRHALAARDIADDLLAANRIAALGAEHHDVFRAAYLDLVRARGAGTQHALHRRHDGGVRGFLLQLRRHRLLQHRAGRQLAVADVRQQLVGRARAIFGRELRELSALEDRRGVEAEPARFLLEQPAPELDAARALFALQDVLDLAARPGRRHECEPVTTRLVTRLRDDLDDVAVLQPAAERHHLPVDACADTLVADVRVDAVREIDRGGAARQRAHLAFRREDVHLLRIEVDLQVLQELLRVTDLLLHLEQLAHPLEVPLVAIVADATLLVFPVRRDAFLGAAVHLVGANLYLEGEPVLADDRRVKGLVAVRPRHGDEVLDTSGHRGPGLVNDAERGIAVLHRLGNHADGDEVVDALEDDLLPFELEVNAVEALDPAVEPDDRNLEIGRAHV